MKIYFFTPLILYIKKYLFSTLHTTQISWKKDISFIFFYANIEIKKIGNKI